MPIILTEKDPFYGRLFLWNVTESSFVFEEALKLAGFNMDHISEWHPRRQKEWMSGRFLLHKYMKEDLSELTVDSFGKPFFRNSLNNFSISHTSGLVGLQYNDHPIGLDLQIKTDKIQRVAHKFCSDNDYKILGEYYDQKTVQLITWGLKEAVFKAYGRGRLSYLNHIILEKVVISASSKKIFIRLSNDSDDQRYMSKIRLIGNYCVSQVRLVEL